YAYQWRRCDTSGGSCVDIAAAGAQSYTAVAADIGSTLRVAVTASNSVGSSSASSAQTAVVAAAPVAPANTALPTINGLAQAGQVLSADPGSWSGTVPISYAYQWQRCDTSGSNAGDPTTSNCTDISGAASQSYTPTNDDVGS